MRGRFSHPSTRAGFGIEGTITDTVWGIMEIGILYNYDKMMHPIQGTRYFRRGICELNKIRISTCSISRTDILSTAGTRPLLK